MVISSICSKMCDLCGCVWQAAAMTTSPVRSRAKFLSAWLLALAAIPANATNYDEAKVGDYKLPDPLVCNDGSLVTNAES